MEFIFKVKLWNDNETYTLDKESDAQKVADWFSSLNSWRVDPDDDLSFLSFDPVKIGNLYHIHCTFKINDEDSDVNMIKNMIMNPDDDGNYPITINGKQYLVN